MKGERIQKILKRKAGGELAPAPLGL